MERSALFHFHGHCQLDRAALTDQSLELADGPLPVRHMFDLKLRSPYVTLIACDSASQTVSAGDKPLGIVTAQAPCLAPSGPPSRGPSHRVCGRIRNTTKQSLA
ncbi:hypothetical protein B0T16DRAFT_247332 [Cercophora newfieldiana]|uniref:CHAT domain-containing protein n=1 Tax=Cercophora newfieldiana TaxID=92897 RepID=A0AA39XV83_9PEZI|nr:hypothetical protein B0T16DRAFT_247332 [Cercophora newfieldiana]